MKNLPNMFGNDFQVEKLAFSAVAGLMKRYTYVHVSSDHFDNYQKRYLISVYDNADNLPVATIQIGSTYSLETGNKLYTSFWQNVNLGENSYNKNEFFEDEQVFYTRLTQFYGVTKKAMEKLF